MLQVLWIASRDPLPSSFVSVIIFIFFIHICRKNRFHSKALSKFPTRIPLQDLSSIKLLHVRSTWLDIVKIVSACRKTYLLESKQSLRKSGSLIAYYETDSWQWWCHVTKWSDDVTDIRRWLHDTRRCINVHTSQVAASHSFRSDRSSHLSAARCCNVTNKTPSYNPLPRVSATVDVPARQNEITRRTACTSARPHLNVNTRDLS